MKLQTERIEKHRAQFTIEIEPERLENEKRKAARKISRQVNIRGFRKGRAPYRLVAQHVGEAAILEEAIDALGDVLYKQAIDESEVAPYGPGAFDDFKLEPAPTFVFSLPLQPEIDLKDYLSIRLDYEAPEVSESQVDRAIKQMRQRMIEVVDDQVQVTAPGNRVSVSVYSEFLDGPPPDEPIYEAAQASATDPLTADEPTQDEEQAGDQPYIPRKGDTFVDDENSVFILDPNEDPFIHGFVENLIDVELGSDVQFELTIPDDDADETLHGRLVEFTVSVKKIEAISLPEIDDEFARRVCRGLGDEETDLAGLRAAARADMERTANDEAKAQFSGQVLEQIVDGADIAYPDIAVENEIDELVDDMERRLGQQGVKPEDYYRLTGSSKEDLREQQRESAVQSLRQALVFRELARAHEITVSDEELELRIDAVAGIYGSSPEVRQIFNSPQMRGNLRNELMMNKINEHLYAIGTGQDLAEALEQMRERMADEARKAQARNERVEQYRAQDEAAEASNAQPEEAEPAAETALPQSAPETAKA